MPISQEHRGQGIHNEAFVTTLGAPYWDWAITGTFYAALHYVDAYLMLAGRDPENHSERNEEVRTDNVLRRIWPQYRALYDDSRDARYDVLTFNTAEVDRMKGHLEIIKNLLLPKIAPPPPPAGAGDA